MLPAVLIDRCDQIGLVSANCFIVYCLTVPGRHSATLCQQPLKPEGHCLSLSLDPSPSPSLCLNSSTHTFFSIKHPPLAAPGNSKMARKPVSPVLYATFLCCAFQMFLQYWASPRDFILTILSLVATPIPTTLSYPDLAAFATNPSHVHRPRPAKIFQPCSGYSFSYQRLSETAYHFHLGFETPFTVGEFVFRGKNQPAHTPLAATRPGFGLRKFEIPPTYPIVRSPLSYRSLSLPSFFSVSSIHRPSLRTICQILICRRWLPHRFRFAIPHRQVFHSHWHP